MTGILLSAIHKSHRKPLAACVASIFALTAPTAALATTVTSCADDGGGGTLRSIIAAAAEGGTVDFTGLTCVPSKITLSGSAIPISRNSLTIDGSGATTQLTIDASGLPRGYTNSRVFTHSGTGTLTVNDLVLTGGYVYQNNFPSYGACLSSAGNVTLNSVTVTKCVTENFGVFAPNGGAVYVSGNLMLQNSTVSYSSATSITSSAGGGVFVKGNLTLYTSNISHNTAVAGTGSGLGGGAYVVGNLNASNSSLMSYNSATSTGFYAKGGGVFTKGDLRLQASTVFHNTVNGYSGGDGGGAYVHGNYSATSYTSVTYNNASRWGGGLWLRGFGATNKIASSTISNNTSSRYGGVGAFGGGAGATFELKNSTISNNHATITVGGLFVDSGTVKLFNSTIAFNTAGSTGGGNNFSPGAFLSTDSNAMAANLQSMLISNNSVGSYQLDLTTFPNTDSVSFNGGALAIPANNLIRATKVANLPTDTKQDVCPHLGLLRDNGGLTYTHALLSHSPAIDTGNDSFLLLPYDQRGSAAVNGTANYTRLSGNGFLTDIGAYEVQQDDIVFNTDFDDCLPLSF